MNRQDLSKFSRSFIYLLLLLVLAFNFAIRWHLRDMPLERDEGEYAYAGQLILQGVPPYELAYNMKFPGVYFASALTHVSLRPARRRLHFGESFSSHPSPPSSYSSSAAKLLGDMGGVVASAIFVCLSALPQAAALAGHATHFVSLFVCAGALALLIAQRRILLGGGLHPEPLLAWRF